MDFITFPILQENLWSNLYKQRNYVAQLASAGIRPLALFCGLADRILLSGKSNAILTKMDRLALDHPTSQPTKQPSGQTTSQPTKQPSGQTSVYDEFVANVKSRIPKFFDKNTKSVKVAPKPDQVGLNNPPNMFNNPPNMFNNPPNMLNSPVGGQETFQEIIQSAEDEFLAAAFTNIFSKGRLINWSKYYMVYILFSVGKRVLGEWMDFWCGSNIYIW